MSAAVSLGQRVDDLLVVETSPALPLVSITASLRSGAVQDPDGKEGLSRLCARLMRRTAGGRNAEAIDERIDALGGSFGVDATHSTVAFQATVISRSLRPFADLVLEVLAKPSLSEEELERLKRETEAELVEARDNDKGLARRWFRSKSFNPHPYNRSVSGTISSIRSITRGDVLAHFTKTMTPDNVAFAFAGDIDNDAALDIVTRVRGALPAGMRPADAVDNPSMPTGRRLIVVDKPARTQTQILIGTLGTHPRDDDHFDLHVANTIFGGTFTARLMHEVRSKRGWSYGAYSSLPYDRQRRTLSLWTFPKAEDAAACIRLELDMLEEWCKNGVTKKEITWAERYLSRSNAFAVDTAAKRVALALDEIVYGLPDRYHADYVNRIRAVTVDSANEAIRRRITPSDLLIVVVGTASDILEPVKTAIGDLASVEVVPFDAET